MTSNYGVVLVTVASRSQGQKIATALVENKLAACVNLFPIESIYIWQGKIEQEQEYQLIVKTDLNKFSELEAKIKTLHDYEVPEIIALPIVEASQSYLNWMGTSLRSL